MGRESISELMNEATKAIIRHLDASAIRSTAGKLIAFTSQDSKIHIVVEEDAWPLKAVPINPKITIRIPNISAKKISCDKPFSFNYSNPDQAEIRIHLDEDECAVITLK